MNCAVFLQAGEGPWYGPSFGPPPEVVGDINVRLLKGPELRQIAQRHRWAANGVAAQVISQEWRRRFACKMRHRLLKVEF